MVDMARFGGYDDLAGQINELKARVAALEQRADSAEILSLLRDLKTEVARVFAQGEKIMANTDEVLELTAELKTATDELALENEAQDAALVTIQTRIDRLISMQGIPPAVVEGLKAIKVTTTTLRQREAAQKALLVAMGTDPANPIPDIPPVEPIPVV